jgi:hypothetical protein
MSDTYNYNSGSPFGGLSGLFGGCCGNGSGFNNLSDIIALVIVASIFGFGGYGGGLGWGGRGMGGQLGADAVAATTSAMISQQTTADRVAAIGADVRQVLGQTGGIIEAVNTVGNRTQDGFARVDTNLCQLGNNIAMQAVNNHNNLTSQLTDIRFDAAKCCCETQNLLNSKFCELGYRMQADKCDLQRAIAYEGETTRSMIKDIQTQQLQERLAKAEAQLSQNAQTNSIIGAIQANCAAPRVCNPCGNGYAYSACNPCCNGAIQRAVDTAIGERIGEILFPPTTAAAA